MGMGNGEKRKAKGEKRNKIAKEESAIFAFRFSPLAF